MHNPSSTARSAGCSKSSPAKACISRSPMAYARARRDRGVDYWPGFVDALSTLILGIIFLLTVFVVVQFVLSQEVTGKDTALARLSARISQLTDLLGLEQSSKTTLEEQIAQLRANLATSDTE